VPGLRFENRLESRTGQYQIRLIAIEAHHAAGLASSRCSPKRPRGCQTFMSPRAHALLVPMMEGKELDKRVLSPHSFRREVGAVEALSTEEPTTFVAAHACLR
jgi:hypothetical protein